jgi:uncharacterized delta-60 repeat protein
MASLGDSSTTARRPHAADLLLRVTLAAVLALSLLLTARPAQAEEGTGQEQAGDAAGQTQAEEGAEQAPTGEAAGEQADEAAGEQGQPEEPAAEEAAAEEDAAAQEQAETLVVSDDSAVEPEGDDEAEEPAATEPLSLLATPEEEPAQQTDPSATPEEDTDESPLELAPLATTGSQSRWAKSHGGSGGDSFDSVTPAPDGGFVAVGYSWSTNGDFPATKGSTDAIIVKFNASGDKVWAKNYGGSGGEAFSSVTPAPDGGFVAVGHSSSTTGDFPATQDSVDAIIVKFNAIGNKVWAKSYGGHNEDRFRSVTSTPDGGFVAVGHSSSTNGDFPATKGGYSDAIIVKLDASGDKVWAKSYGGSGYDHFDSVTPIPDGGFVAAGDSSSTNGDFPATKGYIDAIIAKFNANGNNIWAKNCGGSSIDRFRSVTSTPDGGFVAVGHSSSTNGDFPATKGDYDAIIAKFNANGNKVWAKSYGGSGDDIFFSVIPTSDGDFVAVGNSGPTNGERDAIIAKFNANGNKVWAKSYGGNDLDSFSSVTPTSDGGFVAVGYSRSTNGDFPATKGGEDAIIVKFNSRGIIASNFTGWKQQGSHWYYYKSGTKQKNTALSIKGAVYSFSKTGAMMTGWAKIKGVWRYHASTGAATKGWKKIGNNWYYFKQKGAGMLTGAHKISGAWYVFAKGDSGRMLTGWQKVGKSWYYLRGGSDGRAYRGWVQDDNRWYYFNPKTAKMATGWRKIGGRYYYLSGANDGHMVTGTKTIKGVKYRFNASGALVSPKAPKK